jgi:hypothetical protein
MNMGELSVLSKLDMTIGATHIFLLSIVSLVRLAVLQMQQTLSPFQPQTH